MRVSRVRLACAAATTVAVIAALTTPAAQAKPAQSGRVVSKNVIVLLKNQHSTVKPGRGSRRNSARASVIKADQSGVIVSARKLGATHIKQFTTVNAFSATLQSSKLAQLSRDPDVAAVVPDLPITRPATSADAGRAGRAVSPSAIDTANYCSTDRNNARLEPEALQTMHVAYDDPNRASASKLEDGAGIKVAWIADGVDIKNPDFIRADGTHVFVDYQDFSGDGLAAATNGAEAFGDASSIAAQGRQVYNVGDYAATANPLRDGCYIRVRGVAPGASLVGLKVFGNSNSAPTSHFISAIQYAVATAGVDVLNESFGANPYPDNANDPISLANNAAIAAGVTVVSSTGDAGTNGTIGSPATSSQVIAAGATTTFRIAAQLKEDGFSNPALGITGWADDNISSLSSGGYAQSGKVPDLVAPGDDGWALCTPHPDVYEGCLDLNGNPASLLEFGGTSESAPLTSGAAALVIAAYKRAHGGARPTPAQVKSILMGTAQDLGHPASEQGAGEVDALGAVKAALSMPTAAGVPDAATGAQLVTSTSRVGTDQLDLSGPAGTTVAGRFTVTNASKFRQTVSLRTRSLTTTLSTQSGNLRLNPKQTFLNVVGSARAYKIIDVHVPVGADRLDASIAFDGSTYTTFLALVDPFGTFQAYSSPQGPGNFAHVDARYPTPGTWKAMVWANPLYTGNINYQFKTSKYSALGHVSPSTVTLAAGQSAQITASFPTGTVAGDRSASVLMSTGLGTTSSLPVSLRTYLPTSRAKNVFTGVITGGNGRGGFGNPAQTNTYYLSVPSGKRALSVSMVLRRPQSPDEVVLGFLVAPNGYAYSAKSNTVLAADGTVGVSRSVYNFVRAPMPGRWRYVLELVNPAGGQVVAQPFVGIVRFDHAPISGKLPTARTVLTRGHTYRYSVTITNYSSEPQSYFVDPRRNRQVTYQLASQTPGDDLQHVTLPDPEATPQWLVPTGTTALHFYANATLPVGLDVEWNYGDPEVFGPPTGNSAQVAIAASPEVSNGPWIADPGEPGPFTGPAPSGTVALNTTARTLAFDTAVRSSLGDYWLTSLVPAPAETTATSVGLASLHKRSRFMVAAARQARVAAVRSAAARIPACDPDNPTLAPRASCTVTIAITPTAASGTVVSGHLHVQTLDPFGGTTNEMAALPYAYRVR